MRGSVRHLILYDGDCGLCSGMVRFVLAHDRAHAFVFASLQGDAARHELGHAADAGDTIRVITNYAGGDGGERLVLDRSRATLFVAGKLSWPWWWLRAASVLPTALLDHAYDFIARHRRRFFGRGWETNAACALPRPEHRDLFLDGGPYSKP
jgi:predicted DCC family thiol-disulfide oxidoreductase YuxK